ncbi:MAG: hypothetical protein IPO92_16670 [Saprospiraceae bacterium]|nr:hypothetical protein [Saprospiraceae bacterium]
MKNGLLLLVLTFFSTSICAQKVDIDNFWMYISCVEFPVNYIPEKDRTYTLNIGGNSSFVGSDIADQIKLYGWNKVEKNGSLDVKIKIDGFRSGQANPTNRTVENKDKDGKVTSRNTYYKVSAVNTGMGNMNVYGPVNELPKPDKKKNKEKEEKKKEEKKEEVVNPFLKNVDTKAANQDVDEVVSDKGLAYTYSLKKDFTYETDEFSTSSVAFNDFRNNAAAQASNHENAYRLEYPTWCNTYVNRAYGYQPYRSYVKFKRLDSEKHPEYMMFENAITATKTIFSKMRYNKSADEIAKDLEPVIGYYEGLTKKYTSRDKHEKRLRGASYYNLARIYQYLDRHDKVLEIGKAIIATEYDEDEGEDFIKESEELKRKLDFHHMTARHIVPPSKEQEADEEGEKQAVTGK